MRDPKRIEEVLGLLREYWMKHPDLRLCQIIGNFIHMSSEAYTMEDSKVKEYLTFMLNA